LRIILYKLCDKKKEKKNKKFFEIIGGTGLMIGLTILWKIIVKIYDKYFKKKK